MKHFLSITCKIIVGILFITSVSCNKEKIITVRSLLKEMASDDAITRFPDPLYRLVQYSSYDRRSVHPDSAGWFANNDFTNFIRQEENGGRCEYVMLEAEGSGAIVRWWMTFGNADALASYIRVYIDGDTVPVIEGVAPQLVGGGMLAPYPLSAAVSPLTVPQRQGYDLYLPLPFAKSCKVTLENDSIVISSERRSPSIYYSISARLYEKGTRVVSLRRETLASDSLAIEECAAMLAGDGMNDSRKDSGDTLSGTYATGEACILNINERGRAVSRLSIRLEAHDTADALRHSVIRMSFDGRETVDMPAGNLFGTGYSLNPYRTRYSRTDTDGTMSMTRIMPFSDSCMISIINGTADTIGITAAVVTIPYEWDASSMYFGASWHEYRGLETAGTVNNGGTGRHFDVNYTTLTGKGVYAGDEVLIFNTADAWWGEGDEKIYVDGETFPSLFGTGTEDYYGYAWSRPEPFSHPFIAQPVGEGNFHPGMSVNMRYRRLDAIPFSESIKADIEMWHWAKTVIDYGLTSFYYLVP